MTSEEKAQMIAEVFAQVMKDQVEELRKARREATRWTAYLVATRVMAILSVALLLAI